MFSRFV